MLLRVAFGELPEAETTPVVQDLIAEEATSVSQAPMELPKVTPSAGLALEPQVKIGGAPQPSEAVPARPSSESQLPVALLPEPPPLSGPAPAEEEPPAQPQPQEAAPPQQPAGFGTAIVQPGGFDPASVPPATSAAPPETAAATVEKPGGGAGVAALLATHAAALEQMAADLATEPLYRPDEHDALWRLRFLLSAKHKVDRASADAAAALRFRAEYALDTIAAEVRPHHAPARLWSQWPGSLRIAQHMPAWMTQPDPDRGPVLYLRISEYNPEGVFGPKEEPALSDEEFVRSQIYAKEWMFAARDEATRRTGSLAKVTMVLDFGGLEMRHLTHKRARKLWQHPALAAADESYPQAAGTIVIVNLPGPLVFIFNRLARPLFPKKMQEKIRVAGSAAKARETFASLGIALEAVPACVGGDSPAWPPPAETIVLKEALEFHRSRCS